MAPICNRVHPACFEEDRVGCVRVGRLVLRAAAVLPAGATNVAGGADGTSILVACAAFLECELRRFPYAGCRRIVR
jgi:hypothetical protein